MNLFETIARLEQQAALHGDLPVTVCRAAPAACDRTLEETAVDLHHVTTRTKPGGSGRRELVLCTAKEQP